MYMVYEILILRIQSTVSILAKDLVLTDMSDPIKFCLKMKKYFDTKKGSHILSFKYTLSTERLHCLLLKDNSHTLTQMDEHTYTHTHLH